jgi:hypothetical protein
MHDAMKGQVRARLEVCQRRWCGSRLAQKLAWRPASPEGNLGSFHIAISPSTSLTPVVIIPTSVTVFKLTWLRRAFCRTPCSLLSDWRVEGDLPDEEHNDRNTRHNREHYRDLSPNQRGSPWERSRLRYTLSPSSNAPNLPKFDVALHTSRNMPTTMQIVADMRNMTGICQVKTWM